jgi:muramoyltetrapeptide carboxypeptidase
MGIEMEKIACLKQGDRVALAATARFVTPAEMAPAVAVLESWGLRVEQPEGLYAADGQLAGSDDHRAALMQRLLDDPDVKAIFCVRGGYGTVRIIDRLDFTAFARQPKWIVGYSDVTVLHSHIHSQLGLPTLHGTMPINFPPPAEAAVPSLESLKEWLFEGRCRMEFGAGELSREGEAEGVAVGGNLSILYSLCGSASQVDTRGKILIIEDLDEYLYHIDRMMQNLRRCGMLEGLAGLVVGGLTEMHDNTVPFGRTAEEIVAEAVADYGYPVAFGAPVGHLGNLNHAIPLGVKMRMKVSNSKKSCIFAS